MNQEGKEGREGGSADGLGLFFFLIKGRQITGKIGREVRNYMLVTN